MKLRNNVFMFQEPDSGSVKNKSQVLAKKASVNHGAAPSHLGSENSQVTAPKLFTMPNSLFDTLSTYKPVNELFPSGKRGSELLRTIQKEPTRLK